MAKRRSRRKPVHLPKAPPSAEFLAHGPSENERARRRIAEAGEAVARSGDWPTFALVLAKDRKIAPATLGRNTDALDPARRIWMAEAGRGLVTSGEAPTLKAVQGRAGAVRLRDLAKVEDALDEVRREWVAAHGPHAGWIDPPERAGTAGDGATSEADGRASDRAPPEGASGKDDRGAAAAKTTTNVDTSLLERQIERLLKEKKKDRETIAQLTEDLAETKEALRRALLPAIEDHTRYLNDETAPPQAARTRPRRPTRERPPK